MSVCMHVCVYLMSFSEHVIDCDFISGGSFPFTLKLRDPLGNSFISARLGLSFILVRMMLMMMTMRLCESIR